MIYNGDFLCIYIYKYDSICNEDMMGYLIHLTPGNFQQLAMTDHNLLEVNNRTERTISPSSGDF